MSAALTGMLSILATWILVAMSLVGIGLAAKRLAGSPGLQVDDFFSAFWMGFASVILLLQGWSLVAGISWYASATVLTLGVSGLVWTHAEWRASLRSSTPNKILIIVLAIASLWVANAATATGDSFDYGLYHLPSVQWAKAFRAIPGLGNLHGRLAFNSSYHLFAALLDVGPWLNRSNHLANGLMVAVLLFQTIVAAFRFVTLPKPNARYVFELCLLPAALALVLRHSQSASIMTDLPAAVLLFAGAAKLRDLLLEPDENPRREAYDLIVTTTLLVVALCMKVTAIGYALPAWALGVAAWVARRGSAREARKVLLAPLAIAVLLVGLWMTRGAILSGYPAYPSTVLPLPVSWRVPAEQARAEMAFIKHYGRWYYNGTQTLGWMRHDDGEWFYDPEQLRLGWSWLPGWASNLWRNSSENREAIVFPSVLALAAVAVYGLGDFRRFRATATSVRSRLLLLPALIAAAWWFFTAPTPRFGFAFVWLVAAELVTYTARRYFDAAANRLTPLTLGLIAAIATLPLSVRIAVAGITDGGFSVKSSLSAVLTAPGPDRGLHPTPTTTFEQFTTDSGLVLYVPASRRCWNGPLTCTPQPASNIALRRPNDMASGFVTQGAWHPEDYPDLKWFSEQIAKHPMADGRAALGSGQPTR